MSGFAFFNLPALGHLNPTLPVVKELVTGGAIVHYFVGEKYRQLVESVGGRFNSLPPLERLGNQRMGDSAAPDDRQLALLPFAMAYQAREVVPSLVERLRLLNPDCLVYNTLSLWPRLAACILEIPAIGFRPFHGRPFRRSVVSSFPSERLARLAAAADRELGALMSSFGKPLLTLEELVSQVEELTIVFVPKEFQHEGDAFDEHFLFVGPCFIAAEPEPWPFAEDYGCKRMRAYISLGTLRNDDPEFYRACFSAFKTDRWQVVMSVGRTVDVNLLGPTPSNFLVERSVRQTAILPHVDVSITHGGLNSVMESLYFGVPMVVIPSIKEQRLTADRIQILGCGSVLERTALTPDSLQQKAYALLEDGTVKSHLGLMRKKIEASGGYKRAAEAIAQYAYAHCVGDIKTGDSTVERA
jgi:MGT family glycosyltransferase